MVILAYNDVGLSVMSHCGIPVHTHRDLGWSVVSDCGIFLSYSLTVMWVGL